MTDDETQLSIRRAGIVDWLIGPARQKRCARGNRRRPGRAAGRSRHSVAARANRAAGRQSADQRMGRHLEPRRRAGTLHRAARNACHRRPIKAARSSMSSRRATSFHHSLENARTAGWTIRCLFELAESGSTDYLAMPIEYGDGSLQVERLHHRPPGRFCRRRNRPDREPGARDRRGAGAGGDAPFHGEPARSLSRQRTCGSHRQGRIPARADHGDRRRGADHRSPRIRPACRSGCSRMPCSKGWAPISRSSSRPSVRKAAMC